MLIGQRHKHVCVCLCVLQSSTIGSLENQLQSAQQMFEATTSSQPVPAATGFFLLTTHANTFFCLPMYGSV